MKKVLPRVPRDYDGSKVTSRGIKEMLPVILKEIGSNYEERGDLVLASWPSIIGPQLSGMTQAVSFDEGVLFVKVKNSTLYSLLAQHDKMRILKTIREKFPKTTINNIIFRIG